MTASDVNLAERYFAAMRARDLAGVLALFADDATLILPDGRELAGGAALRQWFTSLLAAQAPSPSAVATIATSSGIAAEIETRLPDGRTRRTANFFYPNAAGHIARLSVYARS